MTKKRTQAYRRVDRIDVSIWGQFVGAVALDPKLGFYAFAYDKAFGKTGVELSPLHMPLNDNEQPFVFTDLPEATYQRLPALLADALPDDFGNALIDRFLAAKGVAKANISALDRLAYMGRRAIGALEFKPARGPHSQKATALTLSALVSSARDLLQGSLDDDEHTAAALRSMIEVGTSAGGARAKAVIAWNPFTEELRSGHMLELPPGFDHWILKFDGMGLDRELGASQNYGRIEYAYYLMAKEAGIAISESRLLCENGRAHFMTKRFDRDGAGVKHHLQSLCALSHMDYKKKGTNSYEQFFLTIKQLGLGYEALLEGFRRMVFNIMGRNCDDHTKNISFILRQGQGWELAPAYDISFAHNPQGAWTHQHLMSVNGKYKDFAEADLLVLAERFGIGEAGAVIKELRRVIRAWPEFAQAAGVPTGIWRDIQAMHFHFRLGIEPSA